MAYPKLRAVFFVSPDGVIFKKEKPLSENIKGKIYARDQGVCALCAEKVRLGGLYDHPFTDQLKCGAIDHILPISRGGSNDENNLRLTCKSCNSSRKAGLHKWK